MALTSKYGLNSAYRQCRRCGTLTRNSNGYCDNCQQYVKDRLSHWKDYQAKKGNRHQRGYGSWWEKLRQIVIKRDNGLCQECLRLGIYTNGREVDHIIPKAKGGTDKLDNLQLLCHECHAYKTNNIDSK